MDLMKTQTDPTKILTDCYNKAIEEAKKDAGKTYLTNLKPNQLNWLQSIIKKAESQKAVVSALITSLVKKIESPEQDVRQHKTELKGGYSGRTFDTKYTTPFLKEKFRRISMGESAWLTRSLEQAYPFDLKFGGKIRDKEVKSAFLNTLNDLEVNKAKPAPYLISLFILLSQVIKPMEIIYNKNKKNKKVDIESIIRLLKLHFFHKYKVAGASRLPVIAIYSIYQLLIQNISRFSNKKLNELRSHTSADLRAGIGDIEVLDEDNEYFEGAEIKFGWQISYEMVRTAYEKLKKTNLNRYYILTTSEPNLVEEDRERIYEFIDKVRKAHGCEIIVNGLIHSIKYYLRLLPDPEKFIKIYTENLSKDFSNKADIKIDHIQEWQNILNKELS